MKIAIIGSGMVGTALATRLHGLGHDVVVGTRNPVQTLARTEPGEFGNAPFATWHAQNPDIPVLAMAQAGEHGELIINATAGRTSLEALELVGEANLANKVLLTLALPLDFSRGMPPRLFVMQDDSLSEQIQRRFPRALVVSTLNTMQYETMIDPRQLSGSHNVFLSANTDVAKNVARTILTDFGWAAEEIIDLGDITTARASEMYSRMLFTLYLKYGDFHTNIALHRNQHGS